MKQMLNRHVASLCIYGVLIKPSALSPHWQMSYINPYPEKRVPCVYNFHKPWIGDSFGSIQLGRRNIQYGCME